MTTATDLIFAEQFGCLRQIAEKRGWDLTENGDPGFVLGLPAKDGSRPHLKVTCDGFPGLPPTWHWFNPKTGAMDQPADTPKGNGYFHPSGRICAPWNRIAYKQVDPQGPHGDWELSTWMTNPKAKGYTTLAAMVLRLFVELRSPRYAGRMG